MPRFKESDDEGAETPEAPTPPAEEEGEGEGEGEGEEEETDTLPEEPPTPRVEFHATPSEQPRAAVAVPENPSKGFGVSRAGGGFGSPRPITTNARTGGGFGTPRTRTGG